MRRLFLPQKVRATTGDHLADLVLAESSTERNKFVDTASEAFVFRMGGFQGAPPFPVAEPHHAGIERGIFREVIRLSGCFHKPITVPRLEFRFFPSGGHLRAGLVYWPTRLLACPRETRSSPSAVSQEEKTIR